MPLEPANPLEAAEAVHGYSRIIAIGGHTKPRLAAPQHGVTLLSTRRLSGITEYDPGEFTFTALAGTPLREIVSTLAAQGQYLPFDPLLVEAGSTLGGAVASGLNGPGRVRFGGIRDFILAVQMVTGRGELLRGGAKVVKNAAGFDFPKFLVGSVGRYAVLVELTFKVFPRPAAALTLKAPIQPDTLPARLAEGVSGRWELDALNFDPHEGAIYARIAGPESANHALAADLALRWPGAVILRDEEADRWWRSQVEFTWAEDCEFLAKTPLTLQKLPGFLSALEKLPNSRVQIGVGGSVGWIALPDSSEVNALDRLLLSLDLRGLVLRGNSPSLYVGKPDPQAIHQAVRDVFDPEGRFDIP